jgi:hypothetical protein
MNTDEQSELSEYRARLASDDFAVVRVALDDYQAAQADTRWGVETHTNRWPIGDGEALAAGDEHVHAVDRFAEGGERVLRADDRKGRLPVGGQGKGAADALGAGGVGLVDVGVDAGQAERGRGDRSGDAAADDGRGLGFR